jgi:2-polyprenyl-3-methyl-5-hydroxy-6-metoxy-1,4-benzoquinol methylase
MRYAKDVVTDVARYRAHKMGFGTGELAFERGADDAAGAEGLDPSHRRILTWLDRGAPARILFLACGDGVLAGRLRMLGHEVTGVDLHKTEGTAEHFDRFVEADINRGIPAAVGDGFDVVVAAEVVQRVREPQELLRQCRAVVAPGGRVVVSVPNFAHWYPRLRVLSGFFDYDQRGILDAEHVRFFTRASFERLVAATDLRVRRRDAVGTPRHVIRRGAADDATQPAQPTPHRRRIDDAMLGIRPTLFAYQFIYELERGVAEVD